MGRSAWARSGAMALTGHADGPPLVAPPGVVDRIEALGHPLGVDALALIGERAAIAGFGRQGRVSCGGMTRLLRAPDGWLVVSLARPEDVASLAAWLERPVDEDDPWPTVEEAACSVPTDVLLERAGLLGLPVARLGQVSRHTPVRTTRVGNGRVTSSSPIVVDLSSLWAGPLCAHLLTRHGARVIKVESVHRPDGARFGPAAFFDLLHAGQESVALDFRQPDDVNALRRLVLAADVVIEASRPRAFRQLGLDAEELVAVGPHVWVSITGYGRDGEAGTRVAFGDDAAVAGGLVAIDGAGAPCFVADAVADPLAGLAAAREVVRCLAEGGRWVLDVAMAGVAAHVAAGVAAEQWTTGTDAEAEPPRARQSSGRAAPLGAHTSSVLAELAIA